MWVIVVPRAIVYVAAVAKNARRMLCIAAVTRRVATFINVVCAAIFTTTLVVILQLTA